MPRTLPILYIQTSHKEHFQSYTYKLHIQNTSNLIHTNFMHFKYIQTSQNTSNLIHTNFTYTSNLIHTNFTGRTLPILYIQTTCPDTYKLHIKNNLIHTNFMARTLPILYIQTSHKEHL